MKRIYGYIVALLVVPLVALPQVAYGQADPISRLETVLPPDVADEVIATVNDALQRGLSGRAVAELALQGVARGRSGAEVLEAARALVSELDASRFVLERGGRTDAAGTDIEAAATAMRMGVDGAVVSELARSTPSGRSLAVPLLVTGALMERGLPSDDAIAMVRAGLEARAGDAELVALPDAAAQGIAQGMSAAEAGMAAGLGRIPVAIPVSGLGIPAGPPAGIPSNPGPPGDIPGPPGGIPSPPVPGR